MILTYFIAFCPETKEMVKGGNMSTSQALALLQRIAIEEGIKAAQDKSDGKGKKVKGPRKKDE